MVSEDSQNLAATDAANRRFANAGHAARAAQAQKKQEPQSEIPDWVPGDLPDDKKKEFMEAVKKAYESDNTQFDFNGRVYKITEKLTGDQDKLDVNGNGKIDGDDLAKLRGEKEMDEHHLENEIETPGQTQYPGSGIEDVNGNGEVDGEDRAELPDDDDEGLDEGTLSKKRFDMGRVNAGAMSKVDYEKKWPKVSKNKKGLAGPGGLYKNLVREAIGSKLSPTNVSSNADAWTANANNNSTFGNHMKAADAHKKAFDYYADKHPDDVKNHGIKRAHHGAMRAYHANMAGHHLDNDPLFTRETNEAFSDDGRQADIHKDYTDLKTRSTADLHKTHQETLGKIHSKYTPGEVGGKQGMIADILRHRHGHKAVAYYFGLSEHLTGVKEGVTNSVNEGRFDLLQQATRRARLLTSSATNNAEFLSNHAEKIKTHTAHLAAHHAHLAAMHTYHATSENINSLSSTSTLPADTYYAGEHHSDQADYHMKAANALKTEKAVKEGIDNPTEEMKDPLNENIAGDTHAFQLSLNANRASAVAHSGHAVPQIPNSTNAGKSAHMVAMRAHSHAAEHYRVYANHAGDSSLRNAAAIHQKFHAGMAQYHMLRDLEQDPKLQTGIKPVTEGAPADAKGGPEVMDPKTEKMIDDAKKNIKIEDAPYTNKADGSENIVPAEKPKPNQTLKKENMDTVKSIRAIADTYRAMNSTAVSEGTAKSSKPSRSSLSAKAWTASEKADKTNSAADHDAAFELHAKAAGAHEAHNPNGRLARAHMDQAEYHNGEGTVSEGTAKSSKPSRSSLSAKAWTASEKADETGERGDHDAAFELHAKAAEAHEAHNPNGRLARAHMDQAEYHNGEGT